MVDSLFFAASIICIGVIIVWDIMHRHTPLHGITRGLLQFKLTDDQREELKKKQAEQKGRPGRRKRR